MTTAEPASVSAVLITKDAAEHLDEVLAALECCAEIVVLDSGSRDDTCAIARRHGARVEFQEWLGYGAQKRRAVALATHDWVLNVDGDEVLDERARAAIRATDWSTVDAKTAFRILRRNHVGAIEIRHGDWAPDWAVRLFDRREHDFSDSRVHEAVPVTGRLATLPGSLKHYTYRDYAEVFRLDYHRLKAARYAERGRRAGACALLARAVLSFLRCYLIKGGILDGRAGVIVALSVAVNACLGLAIASDRQTG